MAETSITCDAPRPQAPPRSGDRGTETVPRAEARPPRGSSRAGQIPCLADNRAVRRGHRARQRPARGGAHESRNRRSVVAGEPDSERHLQEGADLARKIGRPYLEVACLAELAFASKIEPFATTRRRCREAIALAEQHGWGAEPVISPALVNLAGALIWTGEFDEGDYWLQRTARALETDTGPGIRLLLHMGTGHAPVRPPQAARGACGIQRGRAPAGAVGRLTRAGGPADRLEAGHPGPARAARRGPRLAGSTRRGTGRHRRDR